MCDDLYTSFVALSRRNWYTPGVMDKAVIQKLESGAGYSIDDLLVNRGVMVEELDLREIALADRLFAVHAEDGDVTALAASIEEDGQLDPIIVRKNEGRLQLVDGFRRVQAARQIGLTHLKARRFDMLSTKEAALWVVRNITADLPYPEALQALAARLDDREAAGLVLRYAQSISVVEEEAPVKEVPDADAEVEVTVDELAAEVAQGFASVSENLQLVQEHWADLDESNRAAVLEQLKYFTDLHAFLSAPAEDEEA